MVTSFVIVLLLLHVCVIGALQLRGQQKEGLKADHGLMFHAQTVPNWERHPLGFNIDAFTLPDPPAFDKVTFTASQGFIEPLEKFDSKISPKMKSSLQQLDGKMKKLWASTPKDLELLNAVESKVTDGSSEKLNFEQLMDSMNNKDSNTEKSMPKFFAPVPAAALPVTATS